MQEINYTNEGVSIVNSDGMRISVTGAYVDTRLLSIDEVTKKVTMCKSSVYKLIKKGEFPKGRKIGNGRNGLVRWYEYDILQWINNRNKEAN